MNNRHKKSSSAYLMVGVLAWLTTSASLWAADGPPEIGASSIRAEGPTLLYGDNLAGEVMQWTYSEPARPPRAQADEFTRDEELFREIRASLERVLAGKAQPLPAPDEKARWQKLESRDRYTCVANVGHGAHPRVIYLKNQHGISKPYVLNRPEIWGMNPAKAMPGEAVTGWGVNLGMQYALVDKAGKIVDVIQAFQGYNTHSGRYQRELANLLVLPDKLSPGEYSLYNHNGLNDAGWSKAAALLVVERPKSPVVVNVKQCGAVGDGVADDTQAIRKALEKAQANGGGRVYLPSGRYAITQTLVVPENVTLCGESRDSVTIETSRYAPFTSPFPDDALLKPPADKLKYLKIKGRDYIARTGYPVDWLPEFDERSVMVRIQNRSGLENLTFEVAGTRQICQIVLVGGKAGAECEDVVIDKCRFLAESTGLYGEWPYFYTSDGIRVVSPVRYFKFTRNEFSLNDAAISFLPARHWDGSISFNRFTTADPHAAFITIGCGGERVLFQGNVFENTGRGKTGGAVYYEPRPVQHSLYLQNILKNLRKSDGEMILYETGSAAAWGKAAGGGAASLQSKPETPWEKDKWRDHRVVISQGRGMGQIRWITGNTADALEVAEPWLVAPDSSSTFCIMTAETLENLHVGNEYFYCHQWSGVYGAGLRNVWANNEMESVGGGDYLWKIHGLRQMSLNLHLGNRYHERARIAFANSRCDNKGALAKEDVVQMFGNEIRQCFFRRPSYVATENGPDGGIGSIRGKIRTGGKAGNPLQPIPGEEPGIGIFEDTAHPSTCDVDNPILDTLPIANRWNLVADCTFMQCPVGILIGRRVENTVLSGNTFYDCHVPVKDGGLSTIRTDDMYWTAFQAYQAGTNKGTAK